MKKIIFFILGIIVLTFNSCLNLEWGDKEQIYPENNFEKVNEISIYEFKNEKKIQITDSLQIKEIVNVFRDSSSYFKNDKIKFNGVKPLYSLSFESEEIIPDFEIYPTEKMDKLEMAFFEPIKLEYDQSIWRNYNRFYLNKKLLVKFKNSACAYPKRNLESIL